MQRESALKRVLGQFFRTTTLHGFKYLWSNFCIDRWGWMLGCVASTCCAGVLCAVLWTRFLEVPALLELQDVPVHSRIVHNMPLLQVFPPLHNIAIDLLRHMEMDLSNAALLSKDISNVLTRRNTSEIPLNILDKVLLNQNSSLADALLKYSPACENLILRCRWQNVMVPCKSLFAKEFTKQGVCCIMRPALAYKSLNKALRPTGLYSQTKSVDLALQCSNETIYSCKFSAKYQDETNVQLLTLAPGYIYTAQTIFNSVPVDSTEELVASNCIKDKSYSRVSCQEKCAEMYCGCADTPKAIGGFDNESIHQKCTIKELNCLRKYDEKDNASCVCLPSCNKITSVTNLESSLIDLNIFTIDPIYNGLNSKSTVLHFRLNLASSKIYSLNPTETWLTLLSSLGGVFNMFLGVGLFSALEILCLVVFKLPAVLFKS